MLAEPEALAEEATSTVPDTAPNTPWEGSAAEADAEEADALVEPDMAADGVGSAGGVHAGLGSGLPGLVGRESGVVVQVGFMVLLQGTEVRVCHGAGARSDVFLFQVEPSSVIQISVCAPSWKP